MTSERNCGPRVRDTRRPMVADVLSDDTAGGKSNLAQQKLSAKWAT